MAGRLSGIVIEIDGDTSKLGKALQSTNKDLKNTQSQLKEVERSLKFQPGNTELLEQKFRLLKNEVDQTEKKLATLKEADKQAKAQLENGELGQEQYDALRREIIKTEDQLKSLKENADKTANSLKFAGWDETGKKITKVGDGMQKVGTGMSKYVTAPLIAVGAASAAAWSEIDEGLDTIAKKTGASGESMERLERIFSNTFDSIPASANEVANAVGELDTQFGNLIKNPVEATKSMVQFAQINNADVTQSVIGAKKSMEQFGVSADQLIPSLDAVTKASQNTGVSTDKIFESMRANAPILKEMGVDYNTAAMMVSELEKNGLNADQVLKSLQKAQVTAAKDGRTLSDAMNEMQEAMKGGASDTELLGKAAEIFGSKNAPIMLEALKSGALDMETFRKMAAESGGTVGKTFESTLDPVDKMKIALNNLKMIGAQIFATVQEVALPIMEKVVGKLQSWNEKLREMSPQQKEMAVKIAMVVTAAGPLLVILGKATSGIGGLISNIPKLVTEFSGFAGTLGTTAGALAGIAAVIAVLVAAFMHLWNTNEEFRNKMIEIWNGIKETFTQLTSGIVDRLNELGFNFKDFGEVLSSLWNGFTSFLAPVFEGAFKIIGSLFQGFVDVFLGIWDFFSALFKGDWEGVWEAIKSIFSGVWNAIKGVAQGVWTAIKGIFESVFNAIKGIASSVWNGIKGLLEGIWNGLKGTASSVWNGIKGAIEGVWNGLKGTASSVWNGVKGTIEGVWNGLKGTASSVWNGIKSAVMTPIDAISGWLSNTWNGIKSTASNTWQAIKGAITTPIENAKNTVKGIIDRIKGFFNFKFQWPHIPLPHFSVGPPGWKIGDLLKGSIPYLDIQWYDKGGIFKNPAVIGVGEKRPEFVGALDDLKAIFIDALAQFTSRNKAQLQTAGGIPIMISGNTFYVREEKDIERIAEALIRKITVAERGF